MTFAEANQAVADHVAKFIRELAAEQSLGVDGAVRITQEIWEMPVFQLWKDMQIARLTGSVH